MRAADWEARLRAYLQAREHMPFAWGKRANDCASAALGWAALATGRDALATVRDWASSEEADILLDEHGGLDGFMDAHFEGIAPASAGRGDIGLARIERSDTLVIVLGEAVCGPGARHLAMLPRRLLIAAWRV